MANLLDLLMLIAASVGALVFAILAAHAILRLGFALMRAPQGPAPVKAPRPQAVRIS